MCLMAEKYQHFESRHANSTNGLESRDIQGYPDHTFLLFLNQIYSYYLSPGDEVCQHYAISFACFTFSLVIMLGSPFGAPLSPSIALAGLAGGSSSCSSCSSMV